MRCLKYLFFLLLLSLIGCHDKEQTSKVDQALVFIQSSSIDELVEISDTTRIYRPFLSAFNVTVNDFYRDGYKKRSGITPLRSKAVLYAQVGEEDYELANRRSTDSNFSDIEVKVESLDGSGNVGKFIFTFCNDEKGKGNICGISFYRLL